jgi:hypothetical protein
VFGITDEHVGDSVTQAWSRAAVASAAADVDSTPPPAPIHAAVYADHTRLFLSWWDPTGDDFDHSVARMSLGTTAPQNPDEGVEIWRGQPGTFQTAVIPNPVRGQDYAVSVFAVDIHGLYTAWSTVTHLDFDAPAHVTEVAVTPGYFNASFTFTPPSDADYNGVLYAVAEGDDTPALTTAQESMGRPEWISSLKMGTGYTLALWSHDLAGNTSDPQIIHFTTPLDADPPSPVTDLTVTGGDYQLTASWTPPTDSDFKDVELSLVDDADGTVRTILASAMDRSRIVKALPGGHSFTVRATARDLRLNRSTSVMVTPSHRGSRAYLQRWNGTSWVAVTSRTLSTTSAASVAVRPPWRGRWRYHWVLPQHNDHGVGISRSLVITVS